MGSKSLYHYTSIDAVASIIKGQQLLLTNIMYLNDSQEFHEGLKLFKGVLLDINPTDTKTKAIHDGLGNAFTLIEGLLSVSLPPIFTFSLSAEKDDLSQWRAYGNYAIEFDYDLIVEALDKLFDRDRNSSYGYISSVNAEKCEYTNLKESNPALIDVTALLSGLDSKYLDSGHVDPVKLVSYKHSLVQMITSSAAKYKHSSFKGESETRIIVDIMDTSRVLNDLNATIDGSFDNESPKHGVSWGTWQNEDEQVTFKYPRNGHLVPRYELKIPITAIKSIQVGPMPDQALAQKSLDYYVRQQLEEYKRSEYASPDFNHKIPVTRSDTPFKG